MSSRLKELSFPCEGMFSDQRVGAGLSKLEYFALHLMVASVTANDHANPAWMNSEIAEKHAISALLLARALCAQLDIEDGK